MNWTTTIHGVQVTFTAAGEFPEATDDRGRQFVLMPSHGNASDPHESYLIPTARNGKPFAGRLTWDGRDITTIREVADGYPLTPEEEDHEREIIAQRDELAAAIREANAAVRRAKVALDQLITLFDPEYEGETGDHVSRFLGDAALSLSAAAAVTRLIQN